MAKRKHTRSALSRAPQPKPPYRWVRIWVDGGVILANPSTEGVYWSMYVEPIGIRRSPIIRRYGSKKYSRNNEAEWLAVRQALHYAKRHHPNELVAIFSDSQLVVNQFNGIYAAPDDRMRAFRDECRALASEIKYVALEWRSRKELVARLGH